MNKFTFSIGATDGAARTGAITLSRGSIRTPAFMPVGTAATVKAMYADQVHALGSDIVLGNVYHLMLRPGAERVAALGGLHKFMQWPHPILTDSGGFQVMSLSKLRKLDEDGVTFQSHVDGSTHRLTPERSMEIQALLGSDIQMQLDECLKLPASRDDVERAMRLSLRWAERSRNAFDPSRGSAVFGIVQGGIDHTLREESARALADMDFHGLAVGGLAVGEPQAVMLDVIDKVASVSAADQTTLSDGRRYARRRTRSGCARHRHVRLRHADPRRASWSRLHPLRSCESAKRASWRRRATARCDIRLRGYAQLFARPICIISSERTRFSG